MDDVVREAEYLFAAGLDAVGEALVILGDDGRVRHLNAAAARLLETPAANTHGRPWQDALPLDSAALAHDDGDVCPRAGLYTVVARTTGSALELVVETLSAPVEGALLRLRDGTDDNAALARVVQEQRRLLQLACEHGEVGVWEWDAASDRLYDHGQATAVLATPSPQQPLVSRAFAAELHPEDRVRMRDGVRALLAGACQRLEVELRVRRGDGGWGEFLVRGRAPQRDADGRVPGLVGTYVDISERKTQQRRLSIALENGRQGLWEWHPDDDRLAFSPEWYKLLGYPVDSITSLRIDLMRILHPDDVQPGFDTLMPPLRGTRDDFEVEHRLRHADGHYITVLSRGRVVERASNNRALRVIGTHVDITELKASEAGLRESRRLLETIIDAFPQRVFWKDLGNRYLGSNRRFARDAGVESPAQLVGLPADAIAWPIAYDEIRADDARLLESTSDRIVVRRPIRTVSGEDFLAEVTKVTVRDENGAALAILGIYDDVTAQQARETQLETVAAALTGAGRTRLLDALARAAADLSGADLVMIARHRAGTSQARVVAAYPADCLPADHRYDIAGTPCELTLERGEYYLREGADTTFADAECVAALGTVAYAGRRLDSLDGTPIGFMALIFRSPNPDIGRTRRVLETLDERITTEIERDITLSRLRASQQRLNAAIEAGGQSVWEWSPSSDVFRIFGSLLALQRIDSGSAILALHHPDDIPRVRRALRDFMAGRTTAYEYEARLALTPARWNWALVRARAGERDGNGRVTRLLGTITDISALKAAQAESEQTRQFLSLVIDTVPQAIFWQDLEFRYGGCNQRFAELAGVSGPEALIGCRDEDLWWRRAVVRLRENDHGLVDGSVPVLRGEHELHHPGGAHGWFETTKVAMRDGSGRVIGILGAVHDITTRKRAEEAAQRLAHYDPLTNLPNRRYFSERLEDSMSAARRHRRKGALLFIDLDQFKQINDTLGHSVGDALLQAVAERLQNVTRQEDTVARLGGDEFVVLLSEVAADFDACAQQAQCVAEKIHQVLGQPFQFEHHQFHITPTIGVSLFPDRDKSVDDVLKEADTAMYSGKAAGRNVTRFFRREMEEAAQLRLRIEGDLRRAIVRREFELAYQPQVDRSGAVIGAEVLLRWRHPERGVISPADFIPVAEERGLIVEIGRWVLDASFDSFRRWTEDGLLDLDEISINVSSRQFRCEDFVTEVEHLLVQHRIPPHRIVFEITESTVVEDVEATIAIMERLRRLGIRFSIDDFGIGYSSLSYLKRLPIDQLKIDRSFIADIGRDNNDEVICQTIVAMSQHLRLQTIAEGVETREQLNFLSRLRCNGYQGYLFLPPSPEAEFLRYCRRSNPF